ncbi:hypothetical protein OG618_37105 (plasmid) [Kitasatospora sp. NBC_01246]|uniref:hypothetical protein n=1 Tax=Kitasatospora sp. NBC_01246 TaxID=2903570 RepID=UPI002E2FC003|nr:hypothetical protein [Kitasatospora sp. NBC_01246]
MHLTDPQMWTAIVAFFSPAAIAVVQQPTWPKPARTATAAAIAATVGIGGAYFDDSFTGRSVVSMALLAVLVSTTAYSTLFKPAGVAQSIERATSRTGQ